LPNRVNSIASDRPGWQERNSSAVNQRREKVIAQRCNSSSDWEYYLREAKKSSTTLGVRIREVNKDTGRLRTHRSAILNASAVVGSRTALADAAKE
jgi:hypothetical protein